MQMTPDSNMTIVDVECYSGARYAERPRVVILGADRLAVIQILNQWRDPAGPGFDVMLEDGQQARLRLNESMDRWFMEVR